MNSRPLNDFTRKELEERLAIYLSKGDSSETVHCRLCDKEFKKNRKWQEFCSAKCQSTWHVKAKERLIESLQGALAARDREIAALQKEVGRISGLEAEIELLRMAVGKG